MQDYGASWRMLRISSLTDQIFIKAQRIRSIDQKGFKKIDEGAKNKILIKSYTCFNYGIDEILTKKRKRLRFLDFFGTK